MDANYNKGTMMIDDCIVIRSNNNNYINRQVEFLSFAVKMLDNESWSCHPSDFCENFIIDA